MKTLFLSLVLWPVVLVQAAFAPPALADTAWVFTVHRKTNTKLQDDYIFAIVFQSNGFFWTTDARGDAWNLKRVVVTGTWFQKKNKLTLIPDQRTIALNEEFYDFHIVKWTIKAKIGKDGLVRWKESFKAIYLVGSKKKAFSYKATGIGAQF